MAQEQTLTKSTERTACLEGGNEAALYEMMELTCFGVWTGAIYFVFVGFGGFLCLTEGMRGDRGRVAGEGKHVFCRNA